jgi:hypothetical protein
MTPTKIVDNLLLKNKITYKAVYDCFKENSKKIDRAKKIFTLKTNEDKKLFLSLAALLVPKNAEAINNYLAHENGLAAVSNEKSQNQVKLFLLTAFVYNPPFFVMAWNLCGFVQVKLAKEAGKSLKTARRKEKGPLVLVDLPKAALSPRGQILPFPGHRLDFDYPLHISYRAASAEKDGLLQFGKYRIDSEELKGNLLAFSDRHGAFQLRFKPDSETSNLRWIGVSFTAGKTSHEAILTKHPRNNIFTSKIIENMDPAKGISITSVRIPESSDEPKR